MAIRNSCGSENHPELLRGAEYSFKDMEIPSEDFTGIVPVLRKYDWEEKLGRAYLYWAPHEWIALKGEYSYKELERDKNEVFRAKDLKTHRIPLGVNLFHPSGWNAALKAAYYNQEGSFEPWNNVGTFTDGKDHFWLVDAAIGYRLPKRFGLITIGAKNLFDKSFRYYDTDDANPAIQPERMFFTRITLSL